MPTRHGNVSLARALSKLGISSRSQAEKFIQGGHVRVNGRLVRNSAFRCDLLSDIIAVDDKKPVKKMILTVMIHKPSGVITTRSDELGRKTVYDVLGDVGKWVFPVGRLDKDTSGLLLLTNDNQLGEKLTNPAMAIPKKYRITADRPVSREMTSAWQSGMTLNGEKLKPAKVRGIGANVFEMTIFEGKNRQIRKMCEAAGCIVTKLTRISIGGLKLGNLQPGEWRYLTDKDIRLMFDNYCTKLTNPAGE